MLRASYSVPIVYSYPLIISFKWENYIPNAFVHALKLLFPHSRPYFSVICLNTCWNVQGWTVPLVGLSVLELFLQREMSLIGNIPGVVQIPWDELLDNWLTHIWVYMWCLSRQHWPLTQMPGQSWRYCSQELLWYIFLI